jgi:hypothetical protein
MDHPIFLLCVFDLMQQDGGRPFHIGTRRSDTLTSSEDHIGKMAQSKAI